ncbi:uncharacterized protein LOC110721343 [Chenopodium quinoa]|uniref:uncharacterized protein LOC110721343 n=1 Tax=Chenopodium quinoa TaxID=63459 RepID=UPI000B79834C|nr:uncharacterized protein LOC110721343 [Chenopodium quinoa]
MEGKMVFYKSKKNVVAIFFILALLQIMVDKSESCGITEEKCSSFLFFNNCCPGYRCSKGAGHKCVEDPKQRCTPVGGLCNDYNPCCGKSKCLGGVFDGHCQQP